ncbi:hypothetical protein E2C01_021880 [Portunus trituberculatus]|uniref:Uncharacterized protein n=1 Tax=Portunus trituberculatus TaxID=210409 RepID=A0A5B7E3Y2_PORTR|nr:hypothetical protein [Portunus trituberculatus]
MQCYTVALYWSVYIQIINQIHGYVQTLTNPVTEHLDIGRITIKHI